MEAAGHLLKGRPAALVAAKFGVSRTTAWRWQRVIAARGVDSLKRHKAPGRPCRLSAEQLVLLAKICSEPPSTHGLSHERWTGTLLAEAIEELFGVHYHRKHVCRLLLTGALQKMR